MFCSCHDTPAGRLLLTSDGISVTGLGWEELPQTAVIRPSAPSAVPSYDCSVPVNRIPVSGASSCPLLDRLKTELDEYFAGTRTVFDLPVDPAGCTPFTRKVLRALTGIPYGEYRTYGDIARIIGRPSASRAVGGAVHRNPVAILIPCHRVLASGSHIGGFAPGVDIKKILLDLEGIPYRE